MTDTTNQPLIDAVANLIKVKGRFHTEQAYKQLVEAYDAAIEASRTPAAQEVSDEPKRPRHDWDSAKWGTCDNCGQHKGLVPVDGEMVCASCIDAAYLEEWKAYARKLRAMLSLAAAPKVPDGYVIVPAEPTREMINAAQEQDTEGEDDPLACFASIYAAMLAAAPSAPQAEGNGWVSVDERMPDIKRGWLKEFIVAGTNADGKEIVCAAMYLNEMLLITEDDDCPEEGKPFTGWHLERSDNPDYDTSYEPLRANITHWQPLPPAPIAAAPMKGDE